MNGFRPGDRIRSRRGWATVLGVLVGLPLLEVAPDDPVPGYEQPILCCWHYDYVVDHGREDMT